MCKASHGRKKREDEMVTARQVEVNAYLKHSTPLITTFCYIN